MNDEEKTKEQLIDELVELRQRVARLEASEIERKRAEAEQERLLAAEREQRALTEALHWAGAVLSSTLSYEKILDHILEQIERVVPYKAACVMLIEGKSVRIFRWLGYIGFEAKDSSASDPFEIADIPTLRTIRETGWPLVNPYVTEQDEWVARLEQPWIKSSINVPIRTRNRLIGFLHVDSDLPGFYGQTDAERLHAFANQAAIALENARLYDRARQEIARRVKALKKERNFVSAILDIVDALVVVLDEKWEIVRFNRACEQTTGYAFDEVKGKHILDLFLPPEEVEEVKAVLEQLQSGELPRQYECYWITREGSRRLIAWSFTALFDGKSSVEYVVSTGTDITERRQSEEEREKLIEDLEAFAYTVAHDLQEPLSVIMGFADALIEYYSTMSEDELRKNLQIVVHNSRKMTNIIDELLLLTGVRKQEVTVRPLDMAEIVAEARRRLAYMIEEKGAEIDLPAEWPVALGYAPWVEEVWVNYLSNAIKYSGDPPRMELGATSQADGTVRFWIRDNGPGVAPEEQAGLFKPFSRLNEVRAKGHGLGLSIVRRIVEKLGGQVGVESGAEPGQGSVFSFTLPEA